MTSLLFVDNVDTLYDFSGRGPNLQCIVEWLLLI